MKYRYRIILFVPLLSALVLSACYRGQPKKKPPVHIIPDMDSQPRYDTQEFSPFFEDGLTMRQPVSGTVAVGQLDDDVAYYEGKNARGNFVRENPLAITMPMLKRGRERYDVYCAPCHSRVGDGTGIMIGRGYVPPPSFHQDRLREIEDGHIYDVIKNGIRNMPSYAHQIPVEDIWAITAYFRALQRSQNATMEDVPKELQDQIIKK